MKSVRAVLSGILLTLVIGVLVIFGIVAPIFTRFLGSELTSTALPTVVVVFATGFAFYWGGMRASYKAPSRPRLHGVMVGVVSFVISPLVNAGVSAVTAGGNDPFANLRTPQAVLLSGLLFVVVLAASYVGARRGEVIYAHNQAYIRSQSRRRGSKKDS